MAYSPWYANFVSSSSNGVGSTSNEKVADDAYSTYTSDGHTLTTYNYSNVVPNGVTVTGIEIEMHAKADAGSDVNDYFDVDLSWDNGTTWTSVKRVPTSGGLGTTENTYTLGGASDTWGHSWSVAEAKAIRIRRTYNKSTGNGNIDLLQFRVHYSLPFSGTLEIPVNVGTDDGTEYPPGTWNAAQTTDVLGNDGAGTDFTTGHAFRNVAIPTGVTISSAYLIVCSVNSSQNFVIATKILGVDVDDFTQFSTTAGEQPQDYQANNPTTAQIDWDVGSGTTWAALTYYSSPNIASIIQEIVDRAGWASGNDIGIVVDNDGGTDYREIENYEGGTPAYLVVNYYSSTDERAAKITGFDTTNSERSATIFGAYTQKIAVSETLASPAGSITDAILWTDETKPGDTAITHYLSADGGAHWESVTLNSNHTFTNQGSDLRWKAVLDPSADGKEKPTISKIIVTYDFTTGPSTQTATVTAKSRIKSTGVTQTVTAKARIKQASVSQTIDVKARIKKLETKTVTAKARIFNTITRTVTSKARIKKLANTVTVTAKSRIESTGVTKTVTARARIKKLNNTVTVTTKSRIKTANIAKTVTAKSRIKKLVTQTVTAKASIEGLFQEANAVFFGISF